MIVHYDTLSAIIDKVFAPFSSGQKSSDVFASLKTLLHSISGPSLTPARQLAEVMTHYGPIMKVKYKKDSTRVKELTMLQHMAERYKTLRDFLADVAVDPDKDSKDGDLEYLTLSTVHSAKGLEWGRVFLIGLADGVFPSNRALIDGDESDVEEEKRLFYVAVTRAKDELCFSFSRKTGTSERSTSKASRFLDPDNVRETVEFRPVKTAIEPRPRRSGYSRYGGR